MKQYKITIDNDGYPLTYTCDKIADAFECLRTLASWAPKINIDADDLMDNLAQMRRGGLLRLSHGGYSIAVLEEAE